MTKCRTHTSLSLVIACALTVAAAAPPSRATAPRAFHVHLTRSEPSSNDTLAVPARVIRLWFSEKVELPVTTVKVTDAAGAAVALGRPARPDTGEQAPVVVVISNPLAAGGYLVSWSTAARDGHPAKGTYSFAVRTVH